MLLVVKEVPYHYYKNLLIENMVSKKEIRIVNRVEI